MELISTIEKKRKAEDSLLKLLLKFEKETNLKVSDVFIQTITVRGTGQVPDTKHLVGTEIRVGV